MFNIDITTFYFTSWEMSYLCSKYIYENILEIKVNNVKKKPYSPICF